MEKVAEEVASAVGDFLRNAVISLEDGGSGTDDPAYVGADGGPPDGEQVGDDE